MRTVDPSWRWNGPGISDIKPFFRDLMVGADRRIWVLLHAEGRRLADGDPATPGAPPGWTEPVIFDVFDAQGRFLGQVHGPGTLRFETRPIPGEDRVWAVVEDALGVHAVVRFRLERAAPDG